MLGSVQHKNTTELEWSIPSWNDRRDSQGCLCVLPVLYITIMFVLSWWRHNDFETFPFPDINSIKANYVMKCMLCHTNIVTYSTASLHSSIISYFCTSLVYYIIQKVLGIKKKKNRLLFIKNKAMSMFIFCFSSSFRMGDALSRQGQLSGNHHGIVPKESYY